MFLLLHHLHARTNPPTTIDSNWASKDSHQPRADPNSFVSSMHHHHHITNICRNNTICPCTRIFVAILFLCGPQSPPGGGHNKILPSSLSPGPPSQLHPKVITICMRATRAPTDRPIRLPSCGWDSYWPERASRGYVSLWHLQSGDIHRRLRSTHIWSTN